jgi:hypothetical protein
VGVLAELKRIICKFTDIYYFWLHGTVFNDNRSLQNLKDFPPDNNKVEEKKKDQGY